MEKITKENFIILMDEVRNSLKGNRLRLGQQVFNIFANKYIIAEETRGTNIDPFRKNKRIIPFMEYVLDEEAYTYFLNSNIYDALKRD